ncbi:MAG: hypothetical protein LBT53_03820 [Puniceicoccales bacterium]|nr:hypothetical protein [Puniceicoccales bacterium]
MPRRFRKNRPAAQPPKHPPRRAPPPRATAPKKQEAGCTSGIGGQSPAPQPNGLLKEKSRRTKHPDQA